MPCLKLGLAYAIAATGFFRIAQNRRDAQSGSIKNSQPQMNADEHR
jgi:hypothetical protein